MLDSCRKNAAENILEPDFDEIVEKILDRERTPKMKETSNFKTLKAAQKNNKNKDNKNKNNFNFNYNLNKGNGKERKKCLIYEKSHGSDC